MSDLLLAPTLSLRSYFLLEPTQQPRSVFSMKKITIPKKQKCKDVDRSELHIINDLCYFDY
ncbi:hypothetical protein HN873_003310, partial [Arachis hypogaea]